MRRSTFLWTTDNKTWDGLNRQTTDFSHKASCRCRTGFTSTVCIKHPLREQMRTLVFETISFHNVPSVVISASNTKHTFDGCPVEYSTSEWQYMYKNIFLTVHRYCFKHLVPFNMSLSSTSFDHMVYFRHDMSYIMSLSRKTTSNHIYSSQRKRAETINWWQYI